MIGRAPAFWWRRHGLLATLLSPIGALVGAKTLARMAEPGGAVPVPVICVGNPTVGGAGKTPTALALIARLKARGARPFALLRGHGGSAATPLRVDHARHGAREVGDEALLLAHAAPTIVSGGDRLAGARLAVAEGASHIVMDDGFQNPTLVKDAAVLVIDRAVGIGNGAVLPAGPLRAPLAPQVARADALLLVGSAPSDDTRPALAAAAQAAGCALLEGRLEPDAAALALLKGCPLYAFAGIGRPEKFFHMLVDEGLALYAWKAFADHHPFTPAEIRSLSELADARGWTLVTTQKDAARLSGPAFDALRAEISVVPVTLRLADEDAALDALIARAEERAAARNAAA